MEINKSFSSEDKKSLGFSSLCLSFHGKRDWVSKVKREKYRAVIFSASETLNQVNLAQELCPFLLLKVFKRPV